MSTLTLQGPSPAERFRLGARARLHVTTASCAVREGSPIDNLAALPAADGQGAC